MVALAPVGVDQNVLLMQNLQVVDALQASQHSQNARVTGLGTPVREAPHLLELDVGNIVKDTLGILWPHGGGTVRLTVFLQ